MKETVLRIEGMHCEGCVGRVQRAIEKQPGVGTVEVSLDGGTARVRYDGGRTDPSRLAAAVEDAGYTATATA